VRNRHPSALVVCVAGALSKNIEGLSIHQSYLVNFEKVTTLLEDVRRSNNKGEFGSFDAIVERQSRLPECRGMALSSFLLKPVQRLMKYPLFFKVSTTVALFRRLAHFSALLLPSAISRVDSYRSSRLQRDEEALLCDREGDSRHELRKGKRRRLLRAQVVGEQSQGSARWVSLGITTAKVD
jgi:hypothetical protein